MRRYVKQLDQGDAVQDIFLVAEKHLRANRNGSLYLQLELRDKSGSIGSLFWNANPAVVNSFEAGDFVAVEGKVQRYQGALQMVLSHLRRAPHEKLDLSDFLPQCPHDRSHFEQRLQQILLDIGTPALRTLVECFLIDEGFMQRFTAAPAGIKHHHAYIGGLLEHVVTLLEMAMKVAELYPALDRDLLLAGVFLHDIGKIAEFRYDCAFQYTDEGQLVGHLVMGVEMLDAKVQEAEKLSGEPFPQELLLRLKHMILSHHGSYEFGSPKLPMTPEAVALHHLDNLDSKVHNFAQQIREDLDPQSAWTPYNPSLGRKIFKGHSSESDELTHLDSDSPA